MKFTFKEDVTVVLNSFSSSSGGLRRTKMYQEASNDLSLLNDRKQLDSTKTIVACSAVQPFCPA